MTTEDAFWTGFLSGIAAEFVFILIMTTAIWGLLHRLAAHRAFHDIQLPYLEGDR